MPSNGKTRERNDDSSSNTGRRGFIGTAGAAGVAALAGCAGGITGGSGQDTLKMGILEDRSGIFALTGIQKWQAQKLAIKEINEQGGILGKEIKPVAPDPASDNQKYQQLARRLIQKNNVDVLFGAFASSSREAMRPIVDKNKQLYFYTNQYEGGVCDTYTWCTGAVPEQQITPVLPSLVERFGKDIYIIAADYNFGQITTSWYKKVANDIGANVVNTEMIPLDVSQFGSTIGRIRDADPDLLVTLLVGTNQKSFYKQQVSAGLDVPMSTTVNMAQGYEHLRFDPPALHNMFVGVNYMQEIPTQRNQKFVKSYYEMWPEAKYVGQMAQNSYFSTYLYKKACEKAGTTNQDEVMKTLDKEPIQIEAPEGNIRTHPPTHHIVHDIRLARAVGKKGADNHTIKFPQLYDNKEPYWLAQKPYPGCDLTQVIGPSAEKEHTKQFTPKGV